VSPAVVPEASDYSRAGNSGTGRAKDKTEEEETSATLLRRHTLRRLPQEMTFMSRTKDYTRSIVQKRPILHNVTSRTTNTTEYTGKAAVRTLSLYIKLPHNSIILD
jgi:hypothetical protein